MSMRQFANSLSIISRSEHANRAVAVCRHIYWQARKLGFPRPVHLRLSQSQIMDNEPGGVISMVNMLGLYDYNNMNLVQRVLQGGGLFVDVGANIGAYTLIASEVPGVHVLSFEPNPTAFAKLGTNVMLNGRANVELLNMAAGSAPGELHMTDNGADVLNHVVTGGGAGTIAVLVDTLDAVCRRQGAWPKLIKMDVEGHEPQVLEGALECLAQVLAVIVENGERDAVVRLMATAGLRGPFYYRHASSMLSRQPQGLAEDAVFTGLRFESQISGVTIS